MTSSVAGHDFDSRGFCRCGRRWLDIRHIDDGYLNEDGYAHSGRLNGTEIAQIMKRRTEEDALFDRLLSGKPAPQAEVAAVDEVEWVLC